MNTLKKAISSKNFIIFIFGLFILQAVFYASYVGFGIPSDETYHYHAAEYYSELPLTTGPFSHNQDPATLKDVRAIDRDPSYLSHYVLSFPLRILSYFGSGFETKVIVLRFMNILMGVASLYILKRILDGISKDKIIKNLTLLAFSITGMAVWLSGSINYDNLGNMLFLLFIWLNLKIIRSPSLIKIIFAVILAQATAISKYTFIPVLIVSFVIVGIILIKRRYSLKSLWRDLRRTFNTKKSVSILAIILFIFSSGLVIERIGLNLWNYHTVRPSCTEFFSVDECRTYNVFNRNYKQLSVYGDNEKQQLIEGFNPFEYVSHWIYTLYNTLYFQLGDRRFESKYRERIVAFVVFFSIIATLIFYGNKLSLNGPTNYIFYISCFFLIMLFLYNLNTYLSFGQKYAVQGRYLLPILGFIYFFVIKAIAEVIRGGNTKYKRAALVYWVFLGLVFFTVHFPTYQFIKKTDGSWHHNFILPAEKIN